MSSPERLDEISKLITSEVIRKYCALTDDQNPIHLDEEFAASRGGIIANGTLSLNLIMTALMRTLGAQRASSGVLDIRFTAPVRVNDVVTAGGSRRQDDGASYDVWVQNQTGQKTIIGTFKIRT